MPHNKTSLAFPLKALLFLVAVSVKAKPAIPLDGIPSS